MKVLISLMIICSAIFLPNCTNAQNLDDLLDLALQNNLEFRILENEYLAALERVPQVSQLPDPEAGLGLFPLPVQTRLGPQAVRMSLSQMLPWFGTIEQRKNLENARANTLSEKMNARKQDVFFGIKQAYYQGYEIQESQEILRRNEVLLEALEKVAQAKVESGKASIADVLRVQLKREELAQQLMILETQKTNPITTINQYLNRRVNTPITIVEDLTLAIIPINRDSLIRSIQIDHPMVRIFNMQQEESRQKIALNQLDGKPGFGLGMDYIMVNQRTDMEPVHNGRDALQVRASVRIPLARKKYGAKDREEQIRIETLDQRKENLVSQFSAAIEKAFIRHETAEIQMDLYKRQKEITQSVLRILESDYSSDGRNFDELLKAEMELIEYDLKMVKAIVQSHLAKIEIERYTKF